jgi:hypothetical protein
VQNDSLSQSTVTCKGRRRLVGVVALLCGQAALLAWSGYRHSPVVVEPAHLAAGLAHIERGRFDLYRVNPPLVRTVAAAPAKLAGAQTDWVRDDPHPWRRCEFDVGQDLLTANGGRSLWLFTLARWTCIPFSLLGGYVIYRWATELFGAASGLFALTLWCFSPNILGHAALITPDAPAASMAITASYLFVRWVNAPSWQNALVAGLMLGLAELTKTTLLLLYPMLPVIWMVHSSHVKWWERLKHETMMMAAILGTSILVINMGYGFEGTGRRVDAFGFQSELFAGPADEGTAAEPNRLTRLGLGALPIPLPANYVQGIDTQQLDFQRTRLSYLNREWRTGGWPHFYLAALAMKTPLGTLVLAAMAAAVFICVRGYRSTRAAELALMLPAATFIAVASAKTGFSIHPRYVLPALPFLIVWTSRVARAFPLGHQRLAVAASLAMVASVVSSLWCYPHALSYFNEVAGGPRRGHHHLLDSSLAWGQDLIFLDEWLDEHPEASPCYLASFGYLNPTLLGIDYELPPIVAPEADTSPTSAASTSRTSGWYVIDVNHLMGTPEAAPDPQGTRCLLKTSGRHVEAFRPYEPVARVGYSFLIFHVGPSTSHASQ